MIEPFVTLFIAVVVLLFLAPRAFRAFDRRVTRIRLSDSSPRSPATHRFPEDGDALPQVSAAEVCDLLASAILTGESSRDAMLRLVSGGRVPRSLGLVCVPHLRSPEPFASVMQKVKRDLADTEHRELGALLALCVCDGAFVSSALRHAGELLRSEASLEQLTATHTAHARITMRVLSSLPVGFIAFGLAVSRSFGSAVVSPAGLVCMVVAASLNVVGWLWAARLVARVNRPDNERDAHMLVTGVSVSVHAGHSVVGACLGLRDVNECGARIAERLDRGEPLDDALDELARFFGDTGAALKQLITDCASSGLPLRRAADRLAESLRQRRASTIAVRAQQLTTALSMPIVLCMLPSFGLAVLMPLVVASLSSLSSST